MFEAIPVIDFGGARSDDPARRLAVAAAVGRACETSGFFVAVNHGIDQADLDAQFDWAARFFDLPEAAKQAVSLFESPARRGWEGIGAQTLDADAAPDQKESFYCGPEHPADHPFVVAGYDSYGANQWPEGLPGFAAQMMRYIGLQTRLSHDVLRMMALALDLEEDWFEPYFRDPMITLRLLRYPPHPDGAAPNIFGAGAHTDWGGITLLAQDDVGGLEVRNPAGDWIACPPVAGGFVVNLGDMIPRWTNNRYRSTPHRVTNRNAARRLRHSIPFFFSPTYDARIECVPTCIGAGETPAWEPCTAGEHMTEMYRKTYGFAA